MITSHVVWGVTAALVVRGLASVEEDDDER
jgi:hypothetical protein